MSATQPKRECPFCGSLIDGSYTNYIDHINHCSHVRQTTLPASLHSKEMV